MLSIKLLRLRTDSVLLPYDKIPELFVKIATQAHLEHLLQIMLSIFDLPLIHELNAFRLGLVELMGEEEGSMRPIDGLAGVLGAVHFEHRPVGLLEEGGVASFGERIDCGVLFGCACLYPVHGWFIASN